MAVASEVVADSVGVITLTAPGRRNALSVAIMAELTDALWAMGRQRHIGAVILRGQGTAFCAGLDLKSGLRVAGMADEAESADAAMHTAVGIISAMREISQPVIAVVDGWAVGAGFAIAVAADLRRIGADARFAAPFLELGMSVGDLGLSWFLPRLIGHGRAAEVFYNAATITAEQAVEWGLAPTVSSDPYADAVEVATRIASFPPYGVGASKKLIDAAPSTGLAEHLDTEARAQVIGWMTGQARQAMAAAIDAASR